MICQLFSNNYHNYPSSLLYSDFPKLCSGTIIVSSNNPFQLDLVDTRSYKFEGFDIIRNTSLQLDILTVDRKKY